MESKAGHCKRSATVLMAAVLGFLLVAPGPSLPQTPFFQGKTVTIVQGRDPGGTGDMRVRAMMPFLQKYIPEIPPLLTSMYPAEEAGKLQITSTSLCAPMGSLSETSGLAWFLLPCLESRESHTISTSFSIWVRPSAAITRSS